jgi:hypothetical protein
MQTDPLFAKLSEKMLRLRGFLLCEERLKAF